MLIKRVSIHIMNLLAPHISTVSYLQQFMENEKIIVLQKSYPNIQIFDFKENCFNKKI